jgi:phosphoribosylglycinamide formyltransferase 1
MKNIAIFASGSGTNAENIAMHFKNDDNISVNIICTNNKNAYVIKRCQKMGLPCVIFSRHDFYHTNIILDKLKEYHIDLIVLAGFLWLVPEYLIKHFRNKIINIHPALLPSHGGKGMYGHKVHEAVIKNMDKESGITIHFVNDKYDEGAIIFQAKCKIDPHDTPETLAEKVHALEYKYYPAVINKVIKNLS